jgi:hypothetical protein
LSNEERRQRIIEVLQREEGVECPELVVNDIFVGMGAAVVNYTCKEGDLSKNLRLSEDDAVYIGLDRSTWRAPPETL